MKKNIYPFLAIAVLSLFGCNPKHGLGINENASLLKFDDLPENPLLLNAITTSIQPKNSSMTVLYGNVLAYNYASLNGDGEYPTGSVLYTVTWQLQADEQWFGGNIPQNIIKIEQITFLDFNKTEYKNFDLIGVKDLDPQNKHERIDQIKGMKMAVSP